MQPKLVETEDLLDFKEASEWASEFLGKAVTPSNISYLVNYGRVPKVAKNGSARVSKSDLITYYSAHSSTRESAWKTKLGDDLKLGTFVRPI